MDIWRGWREHIPLNHLNLLEYNYIVVPPPNEFCELHISMWKGVQEFLTSWTFKCGLLEYNKFENTNVFIFYKIKISRIKILSWKLEWSL